MQMLTMFLLIFFITVQSVLSSNSDFDEFMKEARLKSEKIAESRRKEYVYVPDGENKQRDRHHQVFIKCFDSSIPRPAASVRCVQTDALHIPACLLHVDFETNSVTQSCNRSEVGSACDVSECKFQFEKDHKSGHCCCNSNQCNGNVKNILREAFDEKEENVPEFIRLGGQK